ncbi:hypothetical protein VTO42DRAFT_898 [Malbranchea cinnamomea]
MSNFNGIIEEFPHIRVDYFRKNPNRPPPLACFLSHVHSDHLQGLESLRAPFVYCSTATREILLRIEKYPLRMNFSKGILESRKQHYKHLAKLLRPIPLQVPTEIELMPGNRIRVTLFDANHCPGAVMFLIEGCGKSILYTGDIRAESWWVDSLVRHPLLIPYASGSKRLDRIYLDTTFAVRSNLYARFPTKAEGIRELVQKVQQYPDDTVFYLRTRTFGYEEVWLALSNALNSPVHVDRYQLGLYKSLSSNINHGFGSHEGLYLCGFTLGNAHNPGCLTDEQSARIHSCEPGDVCSTVSSGQSVYITPIVTRTEDGSEVLELGAGGGMGDIYQTHELELPDDSAIKQLIDLCTERISNPTAREAIVTALSDAYASRSKSLSLDDYGMRGNDEITLAKLVDILSRGSIKQKPSMAKEALPNTIKFPYSRHSSYEELCLLVKAFQPKDITPCTVDVDTWREEVSMEYLFGHLCSGTSFSHDKMMRELVQDMGSQRKNGRRRKIDSSMAQSTQSSSLEITADQAHRNSPRSPVHTVSALLRGRNSDKRSQGGSHEGSIQMSKQTISQQSHVDQMASAHMPLPLSDLPLRQQSPQSKLRAIRQSLKRKAEEQEIEFYLPSSCVESCPTADSQRTLITSRDQNDSQFTQCQPSSSPPRQSREAPTFQSFEHVTEQDTESDVDNDAEEEDIESAISLSPSAFDSQPTIIEGDNNHESLPSSIPDGRQDGLQLELDRVHDTNLRTPSTSASRKKRMEAYRAAKTGSFELWSSFYSPVTAGNNHSEADVEL